MVYPTKVVGTHRSKSIALPVFCLKYGVLNGEDYRSEKDPDLLTKKTDIEFYIFIRDNFHGVKMIIISDYEHQISYDFLHSEFPNDEYEKQKQKLIDERSPEDEMVKLIKANDDNWYRKYSGNFIVRKDDKIYKAYGCQEVYCEGINTLGLPPSVFTVFEDGKTQFGISTGWAKIPLILEHLNRNMTSELSFRRHGKRTV